MKTFRKHLREELKDKKFARLYNEEKELIQMAFKIAETRNKRGLTQQELAHKAHITQQQLSRMETGTNCNILTFLKICKALGLRPELEQVKI
ncbi:MAG TPA: helix-turn-helix transcriptional regulator [bacterium]|nr:helix-turn-helix transcriptional regulator [bacterium]